MVKKAGRAGMGKLAFLIGHSHRTGKGVLLGGRDLVRYLALVEGHTYGVAAVYTGGSAPSIYY